MSGQRDGPGIEATGPLANDLPAEPLHDPSALTRLSAPTLVGEEMHIRGSLVSDSDLKITGKVDGDVRARNLVIGERGRVTGMIVAEEVILKGQLAGNILADAVWIKQNASFDGDIVFVDALAIEVGAHVDAHFAQIGDLDDFEDRNLQRVSIKQDASRPRIGGIKAGNIDGHFGWEKSYSSVWDN